jgi:hypothetical protein
VLTSPFVAGMDITAASLAAAAPLAAFKYADFNSGQSNTTLTDDPDLSIAMNAGGVYVGFGMIIYAAASNANYECTFVVPGGAEGVWSPGIYTGSGGNAFVQPAVPVAFASTIVAGGQGTGMNQWFAVQFSVIMGSVAGDLQWQFAQANSEASNINTRAGSYLLAWQIA